MSEAGSESHKRSKSQLAKSLLHRDRSRRRDEDGEGTSVAGSDAGSGPPSPTLEPQPSHRTFGGLRSSRQKEKSSTGLSEMTSPSTAALSNAAASQPQSKDTKPTIQQSVRMFKLFEVLRSGDHAAIAKAVTETSTMPTITEDGGKSTSASGTLEGTTLLHLALQCADPPVVEQILSLAKSTPGASVDVNARDKNGNTPLHLASMLGRPTTVRLLLEQSGINDSLLNYQGKSALDLARTPDIFQQLQLSRSLYAENKIKETQALVTRQRYDDLEKLLEDPRIKTSLDVNNGELATDPFTIQSGGTLLHEAARGRDHKLIQLLLMHGADPFRRDRKGKLPQDVTKDERTKAILKKSPAAAAAQRGIQEKAILGSSNAQPLDGTPGGKEAREMKGYLKKWTNYTSGWKLRWFVLEDGVMSYYKHQDDAGSACRGAINMRIAKLYMDPQDKTRFEIEGKSSVKYHLRANHAVEAKRWFWTLNNAIQWSKDEVKEQDRQKQRKDEILREARQGKPGSDSRDSTQDVTKINSRTLPATSVGVPLTTSASRTSLQESAYAPGPGSIAGDDSGSMYDSREPSLAGNEVAHSVAKHGTTAIAGDADDDEEYGDDASSHELQPASKDAFNITAHSASLQLNLLSQVSSALQAESQKEHAVSISDPTVVQALSTYESAVASLQSLVSDLLKISRDRDAYWQYRIDREADVRRLWEDSMAKVAMEQEELENRIEESEDKRKRTKRALKDALEGQEGSRPQSRGMQEDESAQSMDAKIQFGRQGTFMPARKKSVAVRDSRRKSTITDLTNLSDSDSDEDEEFFDAVDAGEVEVVDIMPESVQTPPSTAPSDSAPAQDLREEKKTEIAPSFSGYEDPVRKKLDMDNDDRPKISLWAILKSMIGKDMTKMTLPVSFNEPTSLLQRVTEDLEYTDLLDTAADRADSTERMVYVAAYAASEYASTIGRIAKPFNPLLGETYEYVRPDKGYRFIIEQVSHHPPIGAAWAESPKWDYYGESAVKSKFYGKSFEINPLGTWFLKLRPLPTPNNPAPEEELYTWKKVTSSVVGIITGSPTVDNYGPMEIRNHTTGDVCVLDFKQRGWKASSAYQVSGKVVSGKDGKTRWSIGGRWNDKIYARLTPGFEDAALAPPNVPAAVGKTMDPSQAFLVWEAHTRPSGIPFNLTPFVVTFQSLPERLRPFLPPTDTRFRPDQVAMEVGEYDKAAEEKNRVEEKQRAKRRDREAQGEEWNPRWFRRDRCEITGEEYWRLQDGEYWRMRERVGKEGGKWEGVEEIY